MEVELKYRVREERAALMRMIERKGGVATKQVKEKDTYFSIHGRDSLSTKECLRVRESAGEEAEITYKPPSTADTKDHFAKHETSIKVNDARLACDLLQLMGHVPMVEVVKRREYYRFGECILSVDEVAGLGEFIEIEADTDDEDEGRQKVVACARLLDREDGDLIRRPYRDMLLDGNMS